MGHNELFFLWVASSRYFVTVPRKVANAKIWYQEWGYYCGKSDSMASRLYRWFAQKMYKTLEMEAREASEC